MSVSSASSESRSSSCSLRTDRGVNVGSLPVAGLHSRVTLRCVTESEATRVSIEFDTSEEPVAGTVHASHGEDRRFAGWLGLFAALQAICRFEGQPPEREE